MQATYRIQLVLERLLVSTRDDKLIGYKLAATNAASREHLKVKAPFFGRLFQSMTSESPARLSSDSDFFRVHEPKIAIQLDRDLPRSGAPYYAAAVAAATRAVFPAIEIIGTYFTPWATAGAPNLTADNAAHGHWIVGSRVTDFAELDLLDEPITLSINGKVVATGAGRNVDGGAFEAAAWQTNTLAEMGRSPKAGEYITTGSVTPPYPVEPGQEVVAAFGPLGTVKLFIE